MERLRSSTWRESETVRRLSNSIKKILQHKKIKVFSDNKNVQSILQIGSRTDDLQKIAWDINESSTATKCALSGYPEARTRRPI